MTPAGRLPFSDDPQQTVRKFRRSEHRVIAALQLELENPRAPGGVRVRGRDRQR